MSNFWSGRLLSYAWGTGLPGFLMPRFNSITVLRLLLQPM
jgi:hypothetical protein